jgi:peptide/nickel transport system substrate-binding protein
VHNRRAIQYAIDRSVIRNVVFHGTGALAYSQFSPTSWAYNPNLSIPFSDTKAKQELALAGNPQGFSFTVQAQNTSKYILLTQVLQSELAKVGITMHIQLLALSTYITNLNSGAYQADFINMSGSLDPNSVSYIFDETSADVVKDGFDDPTVNNLLNAALATPNQAQRKTDYQTIAARMANDVPMVDLINPAIIVGVNNKVNGFINFPTQYFCLGRVSLGSK